MRALMHDIGDILASASHAEQSATDHEAVMSSEANYWMMAHHGIFQGYYFFHYLGLDRDMRDQFRGHPQFERTAMFCARHDQNAFDPAYDTMPLEAFEPMVQRVLARPKKSIYMRPDQKVAAGIAARLARISTVAPVVVRLCNASCAWAASSERRSAGSPRSSPRPASITAKRSSAVSCSSLCGARSKMAQRRPRQVQRAFGAQDSRLEAGTAPEELPKLTSSPRTAQGVERARGVSLPMGS